ncbi:MAG: CpsD/CapB family tyrosine-protein kinase [Eubacteriales bacterium]|nr:CpsD/CapB family tyrosine-protein kinase [Eubacteriales bacterium]
MKLKLKQFSEGLKKLRRPEEKQSTEFQRRHILGKHSGFYTREAYKTLRTNISFSLPMDGCRKVCVTSAIASEGKSITALNLAISFSEAGQHVLLIDGDLRRPNLARLLEEKATPGMSNVLANMATIEKAVRKAIRPNLDVIFSGDIPPNPSELLGSPKMQTVLEQLSEQYDYIFIDTPPVNVVTDASVVSRMLDGVLFVVRQRQSEKGSVLYAVSQLEFAEAKLLGFIFNGTHMDSSIRYGYGKYKKYKKYKHYGYRYGYGGYGYASDGQPKAEEISERET